MRGDREVEVKREDVLKRIQANRGEHRAIFEKAMEGYRARVIEELDRWIEDAKAGRVFRQHLGLPVPEDHTEDYDRVIDMLEMEVNPTVKLNEQEFAWYVRDDWSWKHAFYASTTGAGYVGDHGDYPGT